MHYESNCEGDSKTYGEDGKFAIHIFFINCINCIIISVLYSPINLLLLVTIFCFDHASMSLNVFTAQKPLPKESGFFNLLTS